MPATSAVYAAWYGTARWKALRRMALARSGGRCEMTPGCTRPATTVDHITPAAELAMTGRLAEFFSPLNVQAACRTCNCASGAAYGNRMRGHRRRVTAAEAAAEWAAQYQADEARLERERLEAERRSRRPAIY